MKSKKKFKIKRRKVVFSKGPIHLVDCDVQMQGGKMVSRQVIEHPGAVVIIPKTARGRFLLVRQFRFAARDWLWEFPAGGIELGESLPKAAARELMEEAGYKPLRLTRLVHFYPTPGISGEIMYLYLAENLVHAQALCDEDEEIECREFSLGEMEKMIRDGKIIDAKTILGVFYLQEKSYRFYSRNAENKSAIQSSRKGK